MRPRAIVLAALSVALAIVAARAPSEGGELERKARALMERAGIPGMTMALIRSGELAWSGGFGVKSAETGEPVTERTVFEAASLSKPIFAYAVLRLVDRGELDLESPLWRLLAYERLEHDERGRRITGRMVLTHTSGLPNWGGTPLEFSHDPGERWSYSGEGFVYLQRVVERETGLTLNELVSREVFEPLGMSASSYVWRPDYDSLAAAGHDLIGEPATKRKPEEGNAAASLHTTSRDYARFVLAVLRGEGLSPAMRRAMLEGQAPVRDWRSGEVVAGLEWALGWGVQRGEAGKAIWHWGDNGVFRCYVIAYPERGDGLVYFTNSENGLAIAEELVSVALPDTHHAIRWLDYGRYDDPQRLARIRLRRAYLREGVDAGRRVYEAIVADSAELVDMSELGGLIEYLSNRERPEEAVAVARLMTSEHGDTGVAWLRLGEALTAARGYEEAVEAYERALKLGPEDPANIERRIEWLEEGIAAAADPISPSESDLRRYVGDYGPRHVRLREGSLFYEREGSTEETRLIPLAPHLFGLESVATFRMRFVLGEDGRATKIVGLYADGRTDETARER